MFLLLIRRVCYGPHGCHGGETKVVSPSRNAEDTKYSILLSVLLVIWIVDTLS